MYKYKNMMISADTSIHETLQIIDSEAYHIAFVINQQKQLIGTVTDGDIRRGILRGVSLSESVERVMNSNPVMTKEKVTAAKARAIMKKYGIKHLPIVNEKQEIVDVMVDGEDKPTLRSNWVVIMAGGLGTRLHPLTKNCPKPLLKVGEKPLLETIIMNLMDHGFHKFYLSVNYKSEMIEEYFGDGSKWGATIRYLKEKERLGTAGALSLIQEKPEDPLLVMNGDILTKMKADKLLDYHTKNQAAVTMCVREYDIQIPYGVCRIDKNQLLSIEEKPIERHFISAGINVISPEVLKKIPQDRFYDMPTLFEEVIEEKRGVYIFPIREYWLDIGRIADYERANVEYYEVFHND
ncbi:nucleotidyltransferase family protein [Halobacillus halophilus]|uniref:nucleotidyltransferase family protein n=1 Tax=Halobacillus halophilus TaxID=1570 RepID=UPI001CD27779|nr:nucleotidyltransferase family protein [Halobacillus halophilus]MCA1012702.1 nucleotidyltransferase family protein [Halobacillus halophilus]